MCSNADRRNGMITRDEHTTAQLNDFERIQRITAPNVKIKKSRVQPTLTEIDDRCLLPAAAHKSRLTNPGSNPPEADCWSNIYPSSRTLKITKPKAESQYTKHMPQHRKPSGRDLWPDCNNVRNLGEDRNWVPMGCALPNWIVSANHSRSLRKLQNKCNNT